MADVSFLKRGMRTSEVHFGCAYYNQPLFTHRIHTYPDIPKIAYGNRIINTQLHSHSENEF